MSPESRLSWKDVRDQIHDAILSGRYGPGDRLPRDVDIADELNCARSTVQRAMQALSDSGIVERRRKGGTRVRPDPVTRATLDIPITRREVEQKGGRYGYQLIRRVEAVAPRGVLAACELTEPRTMLRVEALHLSDGRPYIFEDRWICLETVPEIGDVDLTGQNANEWLVQNKPYSRCDLRFYAVSADDSVADLLDAEPGAALFVIERTTWIDAAPITTVKAIATPGYQLLTRS
ncbi:transcriptional regulator, GntR family [Cribrihabitans marinus]|uniref:Transcriptional regulator, GntR family n=1 Tax=Cribrihabitans marinus TaxID=1227549 RepID=A0A1H7BFF5_9RHOB|nr:GntR family transcriptional regulator [Cribrihabitans marinus]GGH34781.1 GntR family transcriptional regulator [Cribrihabitans marinus]SEJ75674.1 transcriptional regulator, GntR family [Cribrihabitans marinus]